MDMDHLSREAQAQAQVQAQGSTNSNRNHVDNNRNNRNNNNNNQILSHLDPRLRELSSASNNTFTPQQPHQHQHQHQPQPNHAHHSPYVLISPRQHQDPFHNAFTPQSAGEHPDTGGLQDGSHNDANDPKRSRACEACRGLKVRCEPDLNNPDAPCKRCAKANRTCVVTLPSRKRQKKTDNRVAELEKKINALTASLHAQGAGHTLNAAWAGSGESEMQSEMQRPQTQQNLYQHVTNGSHGPSPYSTIRPETRSDEWSAFAGAAEAEARTAAAPPPLVVAGQKRKHMHQFSAASESPISTSAGAQRQAEEVLGNFHTRTAATQKPIATHVYADVVDKGLATAEEVTEMFNLYVEKMAPHMPSVVFPPGTTAAEIRKTKPILFLAILSASAGILFPEKQSIFTKEVMSIYADRIICGGDKTLELIQALIVSCLWYWPPEHFEELKFYQLIHLASVMAIDMGLNKKGKAQTTRGAGLFRDHQWRRAPFPDPESLESRRTWLSCYFLCCNASMGLRRPNLVRWTSFMAECVEVLETSPDAFPSDRNLCHWIKSQHLAEEIGIRFSMDDPSAKVSMADVSVQHDLKAFEVELDDFTNQISPTADSPCLQIGRHLVNLYMHEIAMHVDHIVDDFRLPLTDAVLIDATGSDGQKLGSFHVKALSICLESIDAIFAIFLELDFETVRCLPVGNFVRVAYAVVVLIKLYFAAANVNSNFGKVINKDHMKVEPYLDGLISLLKRAASEEKSRSSQKFLMVLLMLKTWLHRQREGKPPGHSSSDSGPGLATNAPTERLGELHHTSHSHVPQPRPTSAYSAASNSLQLLSEVATGSGGQSHAGSMSNYPGSHDWQQNTPFTSYLLNQEVQMDPGYGNMGSQIDPHLGVDFGASVGDGLEPAMGRTLGVDEYGACFDENNLLNSFMGMGDFGDGVALNFEGFM